MAKQSIFLLYIGQTSNRAYGFRHLLTRFVYHFQAFFALFIVFQHLVGPVDSLKTKPFAFIANTMQSRIAQRAFHLRKPLERAPCRPGSYPDVRRWTSCRVRNQQARVQRQYLKRVQVSEAHLLVSSLDVVERSVRVELEDIEGIQIEIRGSRTQKPIDLLLGR